MIVLQVSKTSLVCRNFMKLRQKMHTEYIGRRTIGFVLNPIIRCVKQ